MERRGERNRLGREGEHLAAEFLCNKGLRLIRKNLVLAIGEVDLLMQDGASIVLVEVKTVMDGSIIDPVYKIDFAKRRKLLRLAQLVAVRYPECNIRVDVVTICKDSSQISHLENVLFL